MVGVHAATVGGVGVLLIEIHARVGSMPGVSAEAVSAEVVSADVVSADVASTDMSANVASTNVVFAGMVSISASGAGDCEDSGSGL